MANSSRHYEHAPIIEALIAFQCELPSGTVLANVLEIHQQIKSEFPKGEEQVEVQFQIRQAPPEGRVSETGAIGYRWRSADEKQVVRASLKDFAFSRLAPYDRWETLREDAVRLWGVYEAALHPRRITRVAVRYINRLDIPDPTGEGVDLDHYFRTAPKIAPELSQRMNAYFLRMELPISFPNGVIIITETAVPPPKQGVVSALLDIDCFVQHADFDVTAAWEVIEALRHEKNIAFEACITDATRKLIA